MSHVRCKRPREGVASSHIAGIVDTTNIGVAISSADVTSAVCSDALIYPLGFHEMVEDDGCVRSVSMVLN